MVKALAVITLSFIALVAIGYFIILGDGKPIGTDLSLIGQGKPTLVLAYENYSPAGGDALNRLRRVRGDYDSRLTFVVADMGTPQGLEFTERYKLVDGQAIFLKPNGQPIEITNIPADEQALRGLLNSKQAPLMP